MTTTETTGQWTVTVAGPDDVHRFDTELDALRFANQNNRTYLADRLAHPDDEVMCIAVVSDASPPLDTPRSAQLPTTQAGWLHRCDQRFAEGHQKGRASALEEAAKLCDVTPPYPFRASIEAAHAIRALAKVNP